MMNILEGKGHSCQALQTILPDRWETMWEKKLGELYGFAQ
jgi:hypothetical protein